MSLGRGKNGSPGARGQHGRRGCTRSLVVWLACLARLPAFGSGGAMPPTELSVLRLVQVPQGAPPYDCQVHGPGCPGAEDPGGRPAAAGPPVAGAAALVGSPAALRTVRQREPGEAAGSDGAALPWQFAQVIVEILAGFRAPGQLVALTTDRAR